jgi:hypothetical protein
MAAQIGTNKLFQAELKLSFHMQNSSPTNGVRLLFYLDKIHLLLQPTLKAIQIFCVSIFLYEQQRNLHCVFTLS